MKVQKILKKLMAWGGRYEIPLFMGKENPNLKTGEMLFAEYTKEIERKEKLAKKMPGSASIIQEDIASLKSKRQDMAFIHSVHPEIWTGIKNSPAIGKLSKLIACRVYLLTEYLMPFASKLSNSARDGFPTYTRKDIFELIGYANKKGLNVHLITNSFLFIGLENSLVENSFKLIIPSFFSSIPNQIPEFSLNLITPKL